MDNSNIHDIPQTYESLTKVYTQNHGSLLTAHNRNMVKKKKKKKKNMNE